MSHPEKISLALHQHWTCNDYWRDHRVRYRIEPIGSGECMISRIVGENEPELVDVVSSFEMVSGRIREDMEVWLSAIDNPDATTRSPSRLYTKMEAELLRLIAGIYRANKCELASHHRSWIKEVLQGITDEEIVKICMGGSLPEKRGC